MKNLIRLLTLALISTAGIYCHAEERGSTFLNATNNSDDVVLDLVDLTFSVNGGTRNFVIPNGTRSVCVQGRDGFDSLTVFVPVAATWNQFTVDEETVNIFVEGLLDDLTLQGFEDITCIALGDDPIELGITGGPKDDFLSAGVGFAEFTNSVFAFRVFADIENLDAFQRVAIGNDVAEIFGTPGNDECDIFGDYDGTSGDSSTYVTDSVRFLGSTNNSSLLRRWDVVRVNMNQGGVDEASIEDSERKDSLTLRGRFARWQTPRTDVRILGFDNLRANSFRGQRDVLRVEDTPAFFDEQTGEIEDSDSDRRFVSTPSFLTSTGETYRSVIRGFVNRFYVPNGVNSRMLVHASFAADPATSVHNGVLVIDRNGGRTRPNHTVFVPPQDSGLIRFDADAFCLPGGGTPENPSTMTLGPGTFTSEGATEVNGKLVPPSSVRARGYNRISFEPDEFCEVTVLESPGNDEFRLFPDELRVSYPTDDGFNMDVDIASAGPEINFKAVIITDQASDRVVIEAERHNIVIDGERRHIRFVNNDSPAMPQHEVFAASFLVLEPNRVVYNDSFGNDRMSIFGRNVSLGREPLPSSSFSGEVLSAWTIFSTGARGGTNTVIFRAQTATSVELNSDNWRIGF